MSNPPHQSPPRLIVFGGLPGTGKTTIARELTRRLDATYLRVDTIEQRLRDRGLAVGDGGYVIASAFVAEHLLIGRTVIARKPVSMRPAARVAFGMRLCRDGIKASGSWNWEPARPSSHGN